MTTIKITINDHLIEGFCDAVPETPLIERKCAAIVMAAMDAIAGAMENGAAQGALIRELVKPTILLRMKEAHLPIGSEL